MPQTRPFTRTIMLLGVVPVCLAIVFLTSGFVLLQRYHIEALEQQLTGVVENTLAPLLTKKDVDNVEILQAARILMHIDSVSHISLYDQQTDTFTDLALPIKTPHRLSLDQTQKTKQVIDNTLYSTLPLNHPDRPAWLVVGIYKSPMKVLQYQGYLILMTVAILVFFWSLYFASRLYYAITSPLKNILTALRQTLTDNSEKPLGHTQNHLYDELVETLNELILMQQSIRDEMQNNVDQSTKELRETLETVEIQNIELDFARKNALQASRAKSEFLANTSHELRTPLNGILGFTSLLLKTGLTNQQKDYLSTIEQSAQGLLTVISDILDFSKLETGQLTLEYKPIYVRELIEEVFAIYAPQAHEKNMRLLTIINHNVPRNLLGDPQRLKQVINNLISNAIKFSAQGNVIVRAASLGETDNQIEIKFSVTDNGIGLTEEQQDNLFSAFTRVDNSDSRIQGGTGLGLAIAKGLVDRMNGEIGVESEAQKGSTFWFTVRLGLDRQRISQSPLVNSLYGINALVFDCNPVCRMEITHLLTNWGVSFIEENHFSNIANTLASSTNDTPVDLLILDAYTEENSFEREKLLAGIHRLKNTFRLPTVILAPPAIQRLLQNDIVGLNTQIVPRPVVHSFMHQTMCNLLNISQRFAPSTGEQLEPPEPKLKNKGIRILVVDDHPANLKLVGEFLKGLGVEVKTTNSGAEALTICEQETFSLILMDVQMPGLDGYATTKLLRSKEVDTRTPIVALTAHAVNEQKTQLLLAGMDDFLSKPVSEDDLKHIIGRWANTDVAQPSVQEKIPESNHLSAAIPVTDVLMEFDWKESLRLAKNKPDLATDLLKILLGSLDETSAGIRNALKENNMQNLLEITHKFHGGCCYCGVPAVRQASKKLEEVLHQRDYREIKQLTDQLLGRIESLTNWSHTIDVDTLFGDLEEA